MERESVGPYHAHDARDRSFSGERGDAVLLHELRDPDVGDDERVRRASRNGRSSERTGRVARRAGYLRRSRTRCARPPPEQLVHRDRAPCPPVIPAMNEWKTQRVTEEARCHVDVLRVDGGSGHDEMHVFPARGGPRLDVALGGELEMLALTPARSPRLLSLGVCSTRDAVGRERRVSSAHRPRAP